MPADRSNRGIRRNTGDQFIGRERELTLAAASELV
jgi:hypothetical protein